MFDYKKYELKNSLQLKDALGNLKLDDDEMLFSYDVVAMYKSIPQEAAIECVMGKWEVISQHTTLDHDSFEEALRFYVLENNFFLYERDFYEQVCGLAMGSSLSGTLAHVFMNDFIDKALRKLGRNLKFFKKYVDDTIVITDLSTAKELLDILNMLGQRKVRFTMESEKDRRLPFLDLLLIRTDDQQIMTDWYTKEISSGRLLNFHSAHPVSMKVNVATSFAKRVLHLSDAFFHTLYAIRYPKTKQLPFQSDQVRHEGSDIR